jgi:hypothetical protein
LDRLWPDRDGNISYLLTLCVDGRSNVLANETTFLRLVDFLLDSPTRYHWFGRRFVIMPDHLHLIAHQAQGAIRLGQWIKALKAVVGGLHEDAGQVCPPGAPCASPGDPVVVRPATAGSPSAPGSSPAGVIVGRVPSPGGPHSPAPRAETPHQFTRLQRPWRWQSGFHDHKFRTPESESRKWEYVCLNPVRRKLVARPEQWPYGGEIFYDQAGGPRLVRGTPPLLETGLLIEADQTPPQYRKTPGEGTRPTT